MVYKSSIAMILFLIFGCLNVYADIGACNNLEEKIIVGNIETENKIYKCKFMFQADDFAGSEGICFFKYEWIGADPNGNIKKELNTVIVPYIADCVYPIVDLFFGKQKWRFLIVENYATIISPDIDDFEIKDFSFENWEL